MRHSSIPPHGNIRLLQSADPQKGAGNRIVQHRLNQSLRRKKTGQYPGGIDLVDQKPFPPKKRFISHPVQHLPLQEIAAALENIHPPVCGAPKEDIIIMGGQPGKTYLPPGLKLAQRVQSASCPEDLILMGRVCLVDKIYIRTGPQIFTGCKRRQIHLIAVVKPGFVRNDDLLPAHRSGKFSQLYFRVPVFRNNSRVKQIASQAKRVIHHSHSLIIRKIKIFRQNRNASGKHRNGAEADLRNHQSRIP